MNQAVFKSPSVVEQKMMLGGARARRPLDEAPAQTQPSAEELALQALHASLRAELEAQYQAKLEAVRQEAVERGYKEGFESGHREGAQAAAESHAQKARLLEQVLLKAEEATDAWLAKVEHTATEIAFEVLSGSMVEGVFAPDVLAAMVRQVGGSLRETDVLAIRLHPKECQALKQALKQPNVQPLLSGRLAAKLTEDLNLQSGGFVIDTPRGEYRATLDIVLGKLNTMLQARRDVLTPSLAEPADHSHVLRA